MTARALRRAGRGGGRHRLLRGGVLLVVGLAAGDPSTIPHGLLTAVGWALGINT